MSASLAASIPASAQVSPWSAVPPLMPIAPICTLSSVMIGKGFDHTIIPDLAATLLAHFVCDPPTVTGTASFCVGSRISMGFSVSLVSKAASRFLGATQTVEQASNSGKN